MATEPPPEAANVSRPLTDRLAVLTSTLGAHNLSQCAEPRCGIPCLTGAMTVAEEREIEPAHHGLQGGPRPGYEVSS
jgi:hypothetical protein